VNISRLRHYYLLIILIIFCSVNALGEDIIPDVYGEGRPNLLIGGIYQKSNTLENNGYIEFADRYNAMYVPTYYSGNLLKDCIEVDNARGFNYKENFQNGLARSELKNKHYNIIFAYSGGTRSALTAIEYQGLRTDTLVLISPIRGTKEDQNSYYEEEIKRILNKVKNIVVLQSSNDQILLDSLLGYQARFSEIDDPRIEVYNVPLSKNGREAHQEIFFTYALKHLSEFDALNAAVVGASMGTPQKFKVTLTLYMYEREANGPAIPNAMVSAQDGSGKGFLKATDRSGSVSFTGDSGGWSITASAPGYNPANLFLPITGSVTEHVVLTPVQQEKSTASTIDPNGKNEFPDLSRWLDSVIAWISPWVGMNQGTASSNPVSWNKTFGDNSGFACAQQTADGGYIAVGSIDSWITFKEDTWIVKTDAYGNKQWEKTYGGFDDDSGGSVQQTIDGGYIIEGTTYSHAVSDYAWLIKIDANGNKQWERAFAASDRGWGEYVQQTSDGGYIFLYHDGHQIALAKVDENGSTIWSKYLGESDSDCTWFGHSVQQASDDGYFIIGSRCFSSDLERKKAYAWLIKTDKDGNKIWDRAFGESGLGDEGYSIRLTRDGGCIFAGKGWWRSDQGNIAEGIWIIQADSYGNRIWEKPLRDSAPDALHADSLCQANDGGYVTIGIENGKASLIKTDSNGDRLWSRSYGGSYPDRICSVGQTEDGGYILAGTLDPDRINPNDNIAWLIKTDANGNI
jgi:hypothetical protein